MAFGDPKCRIFFLVTDVRENCRLCLFVCNNELCLQIHLTQLMLQMISLLHSHTRFQRNGNHLLVHHFSSSMYFILFFNSRILSVMAENHMGTVTSLVLYWRKVRIPTEERWQSGVHYRSNTIIVSMVIMRRSDARLGSLPIFSTWRGRRSDPQA